jgi:hypothetical protein
MANDVAMMSSAIFRASHVSSKAIDRCPRGATSQRPLVAMKTFLLLCGGAIMTVLLGGLSHGVWEKVQRPIFDWLVNRLQLSGKAWHDRVFLSISLRPKDAAARWLGTHFVGILFLTIIFIGVKEFAYPAIEAEIISEVRAESVASPTLEKQIATEQANARRITRNVSLGVGILVFISIAVSAWFEFYKRVLTTRSDFLLTLAKPLLGEKQVQIYEAQFAAMRGSDDYKALVAALKKELVESKLPYLEGREPTEVLDSFLSRLGMQEKRKK